MKRILNKWQIHFRIGRAFEFHPDSNRYKFEFFIIKVLEFPPERLYLAKEYYKGFMIDINFLFVLPKFKIIK